MRTLVSSSYALLIVGLLQITSLGKDLDPTGVPKAMKKHGGFYIWVENGTDWHLALKVTKADERKVEGTVQIAGATIKKMEGFKLEIAKPHPDMGLYTKHAARFLIDTSKKHKDNFVIELDGPAKEVSFDIKLDKGDSKYIHVGHDGKSPGSCKFTLPGK